MRWNPGPDRYTGVTIGENEKKEPLELILEKLDINLPSGRYTLVNLLVEKGNERR